MDCRQRRRACDQRRGGAQIVPIGFENGGHPRRAQQDAARRRRRNRRHPRQAGKPDVDTLIGETAMLRTSRLSEEALRISKLRLLTCKLVDSSLSISAAS